jgi:phenylalanine-4-hydroxylase
MPAFATYLKEIGEAGSKAFSSKKDVELYEAIRHLSIIKEDSKTKAVEIHEAESAIEKIQGNMGPPSELALIRNLHWWTVEYGLIGTVDDYRLYGAGLLSSIGEGMSCLSGDIKKLPYTLEAMHCNYDITKRQPQLFVTPDFTHLTTVLEQFKGLMAWTTGGLDGVKKAIDSEQTATVVFSSGLEVTGTFIEVVDADGHPAFVRTAGPSALSFNNSQLPGYGKDRFDQGFSSPVGHLSGETKPLEDMSESELSALSVQKGKICSLTFDLGINVEGQVEKIIRSRAGKILVIDLRHATVRHNGEVILILPNYSMGVGERIISAFAGPADVEAFQPTAFVPHEKMHKITYDEKDLRLHELYRIVRQARSDARLVPKLSEIWKTVRHDFPNDWLLPLEILEILQGQPAHEQQCIDIRNFLEEKRIDSPHLENLITNGLKLLKIETP